MEDKDLLEGDFFLRFFFVAHHVRNVARQKKQQQQQHKKRGGSRLTEHPDEDAATSVDRPRVDSEEFVGGTLVSALSSASCSRTMPRSALLFLIFLLRVGGGFADSDPSLDDDSVIEAHGCKTSTDGSVCGGK